jgi:hypothetical protein
MISSLIVSALTTTCPQTAVIFRNVYPEPVDQSIEGQIRAANEFWRVKLGFRSDAKSISAREALVDCDLENWIRLFRAEVAPRVVKINPNLD